MKRTAAKVDRNQSAIVDALRLCGCSVQSLAQIGQGCPDLLIGIAGMNVLAEVKDGTAPASKRKLTKDQRDWHGAWRGKVLIFYSVDEVLTFVDFMKGRLRRPGIPLRPFIESDIKEML